MIIWCKSGSKDIEKVLGKMNFHSIVITAYGLEK